MKVLRQSNVVPFFRAALASLAMLAIVPVASAQDCKPKVDDSMLVKPGTLIMTFNATLPPRQFVDTTGKLQGYGVELGELVAKHLCLKPEMVNIEFSAQVPGLQAGRWDIVATGLFYTLERSKMMHMVPYGIEDISVTVQKGNPLKITKVEDLQQRAVGVEHGSFQEKELKRISGEMVARGLKPVDVRTFDNYAHIYANLNAGQLDAVISSGLVGEYYAQRGRFESAIRGVTKTGLALGLKNQALAEAVGRALTDMKRDGSYDALHTKYGALPFHGEFRITTGDFPLN